MFFLHHAPPSPIIYGNRVAGDGLLEAGRVGEGAVLVGRMDPFGLKEPSLC